MRPFLKALQIAAASGGVLLAACATKPLPPGANYIVTAPKTSFYKYGPAQSFGPDFVLVQGQQITMMERSYGFSKVMTGEGISGYISSEDITPAPLTEPKPAVKPGALGANPKPQVYSGKRKQSNMEPTPGLPLFDVNDVPLPLSEVEEAPKVKPKFRAGTPASAPTPEH